MCLPSFQVRLASGLHFEDQGLTGRTNVHKNVDSSEDKDFCSIYVHCPFSMPLTVSSI